MSKQNIRLFFFPPDINYCIYFTERSLPNWWQRFWAWLLFGWIWEIYTPEQQKEQKMLFLDDSKDIGDNNE